MNSWVMAKDVFCKVKVTLTSDLWPPNSNQFILESYCIYIKFDEIPWIAFSDMVFMRMGQHKVMVTFELWPLGSNHSSLTWVIADLNDKCEEIPLMHFWENWTPWGHNNLELWPPNSTKIGSSSSPNLFQIEEIPWRRSGDIAFLWTGWTDGQTNRTHNAGCHGCRLWGGTKISKIKRWKLKWSSTAVVFQPGDLLTWS